MTDNLATAPSIAADAAQAIQDDLSRRGLVPQPDPFRAWEPAQAGKSVLVPHVDEDVTLALLSPNVPNRNGIVVIEQQADLAARPDPAIYSATCFAAGTSIATVRGDVAVDTLREGDVAALATGGTAPIVWVGYRRLHDAEIVRVRARAFAGLTPMRDLLLTPEHAVFVAGHLIPVHALVNGLTIVSETWESVVVFHVELERHGALLAEGLPAESYLDTGHRSNFANGALVTLRPDFERPGGAAEPFAPVALSGRVVDSVHASLLDHVFEPDLGPPRFVPDLTPRGVGRPARA